MDDAAVAHIDLRRADQALADIGQAWLQTPHQQQIDHQVEVMAHGRTGHAEPSGKVRGVQQAALVMGEHRPQAPQRLGRHAGAELRDVALEIGADEVGSPAQALHRTGGKEAGREPATHPELVPATLADLDHVEGRQFHEGNATGQGLAALGKEVQRRRAEEKEAAVPLSLSSGLVDGPPQFFEQAWRALDLVEDHELVGVVGEVELWLGQPRPIGGRLQVEIDRVAGPGHRQGKGGLPDLAGPGYDHGRRLLQQRRDYRCLASFNHPCNSIVELKIYKDKSASQGICYHPHARSRRMRKIGGLAAKAKASAKSDPLAPFSAATRRWFEASFEGPTPAQTGGWEAISSGEHTLICAPTGSGKTLASFLWGIDKLARSDSLGTGVKLVYISPLKALSYDIERNLRAPLRGIGAEISVGLRTGDTSQKERRTMAKEPPDILITTPESLYLMLSSSVREILTGVEAVIVDEIHAVAPSKRGSHLALTLERLDHHVRDHARQAAGPVTAGDPPPLPVAKASSGEVPPTVPPAAGAFEHPGIQRIGLSATQRPLERIGQFLVGPKRECRIVDAGQKKALDLEIVVPVEDMADPGAPAYPSEDGAPPTEVEPSAHVRSIWPAIYPKLLELVQEHTSTMIFVNNRRGAERLAKRLNELANGEGESELPATEHAGHHEDTGEPHEYVEIARAHHGSLSHEERAVVEEMLKSGQLPCLVATSSLELGIDMGAVDLVIQVESPKSVTRGLQRIGRAGHRMGEVSKGRIFPKYRGDLLECAVVARRMREAQIEETTIPQNPLDVLAQHLVSIAAHKEWEVDEVERLVTATQPFHDLSREQLENVLDMLDGRYPSDRFAELRPRIVWDRTEGTIHARKGARQLVVTNAGTIPDRGLYGVHLPDGRRVGELDEEMVYEARAGQTFLLGSSTWRIEEITRDRVIVTPAPGAPGAVPFWKGDGIGRPKELGEAIGAFAREAVDRDPAELASEYDLDERAAKNLSSFLREQRDATRVVPSDRTIVVERFRDEIGDWRLCVLSPFGGRVHSAWALALSARIRDEFGLESDAIWSDDGIIVHLPDADEPPGADLVLVAPDELEELVVRELSGSALFGARFRENAARALLIPRARPGKRTPLWQQRLKAQTLLEVAKRYGDFPIILETYRECLRDVLDLPGLEDLLGKLHRRELSLVEVETETASPFASSLLFDYVATYMYEGDTPNAERRAAALSLDRELLRELLGQDELRELIDADALDQVEEQLRGSPRDPDELHDVLRRRGDLRTSEYDEGQAAILLAERRALPARIAGDERLIATEDAGRYRDGLGVMPPGGLPEAFLEGGPDSLRQLVLRFAKGRGPFTTAEAEERFGLELGRLLHE